MDFFVVSTVNFTIVYVFFIIEHARRKVLHFNVTEHPTTQWPHSGFNIHNEVEISADDEKGRQTLAQYIIKAPVSQEMVYDKKNGKVTYKSKHGTIVYDP